MKTARIAALLAFLLFTHSARGQESNAPDATLEEIQQHLKAWRSQFSSVQLTMEERNPNEVVAYRPELKGSPLVDGYYFKTIWTWSDQGAARHDDFDYDAGRLMERRVEVANGIRLEGFKAVYKDTKKIPQFLESLSLRRLQSPVPGYGNIVVPLYNLLLSKQGHGLDELIELGKASLEGHEKIRGIRCPKLRVGGQYNDEYIWLDPSHAYLPVKSSPVVPGGAWYVEVLEFRHIDPGIWFPSRGTRWSSTSPPDHVTQWLVTELSVNQPVDESLFEPPPPMPETQVSDASGSYRPADRAAKRPRTAEADEPPPAPIVRGWHVILGVGLALAIGLGAWLVGRRRDRSSVEESKLAAVLVLLACAGICVVFGLVATTTIYLTPAWTAAAALLVLEAIVTVVVLRIVWLYFRPNLRFRLRFSLLTALLATTAIASALGLTLHLQPHIAWRFGPNWNQFIGIQKASVVSMPEVAVPADWQGCRFGSLQLAVPARFGNVAAAEDGSCVALNSTSSRHSIYISFPLEVEEKTSNQGRDLSAIELELASYRAGRDDFHWMMTHDELRWHQWCLGTRKKLLRLKARGWAESLLREDLEGVLLFIGDGSAFFEWRAKDDSVEGGVTFYGIDEKTDADWIRAVCQSARLSGKLASKPANQEETLKAFESL